MLRQYIATGNKAKAEANVQKICDLMRDHRAAISGAGTHGPASPSTKSHATWGTVAERKEEKQREASELPKGKSQVLKSA